MATQPTDTFVDSILAQLRETLPEVIRRAGDQGQRVVHHITPRASAVRIELLPG